MIKRKNMNALWTPDFPRNFSLGIIMGALFVCAIFVYSMGATRLGSWGEVPGWIAFMSVDIVTGNIWGLWTGEWKAAPQKATQLLKIGMIVIVIAIVFVAIGQGLNVETNKVSEPVAQVLQSSAQTLNMK